MLRAGFVSGGILLNVLLSFISYKTGFPIYLDTIGTISAAATGGLFPGILTAIVTNALCTAFNGDAIYFGFVNALIAIYTAWFVREKSFGRLKYIVRFIVVAGLFSGVVSALIQWGLLGGPQNASVVAITDILQDATGLPAIFSFIILQTAISILDKGVSVVITLFILHFIPQNIKTRIRNSGWRQRPLSREEMEAMDSLSGDIRISVKKRMTLMLMIVAFALSIFMGFAGIRLYFNNAKQEKTEIAQSAVQFAAQIVDPDRISEYILRGRDVPGYEETEKMLYRIRDNAKGVKYLYVLQIREDGCYTVFDLDAEGEPGGAPGTRIEFEEAFYPYLPALLAGEEIEPVESDDISGWVLTVYEPIKNGTGRTMGYACADASLTYLADYIGDFMLRIILILSGSFVLILAYALWTTGIYMVYPINNLVAGVEDFIATGTEQEKLDESVRALRAIDIHTGDEIEKLYQAVCKLALSQAEQMRSIRRYSENTEKMQDGLIVTMADLVENRDSDTGAHIQKTAAYVKIIAEGLKRKGYYAEKITPKFISDVVRSAPLHDVGKINIPDEVLNKPGKLTDEEYAVIKTHTISGKRIMEKAISTVEGENYLKEARNMAAYHHERWDGKGYPEGLHGEVIPLSARIMAVADVFDALASPRVYKPAFPFEKALSIIEEGSGTQFDPRCVEVFMDALSEVRAVLKKYHGDV
ncbi:MAG: HD-GYP domain-containing protein [Lachnospiraceae bacterium]|nr:HD-GYP domain-containing protein [Lachnospiraceae bacterium]